MPTNNHVLLRRIVLSETSATISIANLPQTGYKHLRVLLSGRADEANGGYQNGFWLTLNGATSNYTHLFLQYEGSTSINSDANNYYSRTSAIPLGGAVPSDWTANTYGNTEFWITNYTSSDSKAVMSEGTGGNFGGFGTIMAIGGLWSDSTAVNTITLDAFSNGNGAANFVQGTSVSVYGIAGENQTPSIAPYATGGDIISRDSTYYYHAFLKSGLFTPIQDLTADVLVIAGGGGAGNNGGGGGGAGGVLLHSSQSLTQQSYTAVVGAGGITQKSNRGLNGSNSQFASLTASVGGGGGGSNVGSVGGNAGGSGGGAGAAENTPGPGAGTAGQGFAGGAYVVSNSGGGGGGAGEAGNTDGGSQGGDGTNAYSSWASATRTGVNGFYAGGGGGGSNNLNNTGAGGDGGGGGNATPGTRNTGSGGGTNWTSGSTGFEGSGGSGIIIVRYEI
jgi:hypothetical protein